METVDINKIVEDIDQPRVLFDESKLAMLRESIKEHGIISPLIVQKTEGGKYLLIDGARRYRSAKEIGLAKVPVIIENEQDKARRLIKQFHIQEMHEGWQSTEKANALLALSEELGVPVRRIAQMLKIPDRTAIRYEAFTQLISKDEYQKANVDIAYAASINQVCRTVDKIYQFQLDRNFTKTERKELEGAIIRRLKSQVIKDTNTFTKIKDSFHSNPDSIQEFIDTEITPEELFLKTGAKGSYYLRNIANNLTGLTTSINGYLKNQDVKIDPELATRIKVTRESLEKLYDLLLD